MDRSAEQGQASSTLTDDEVRRLLRDSNPELPEDPPGQAELLAWLARETRDRLRLDRLWVLAVALPLKGALLGAPCAALCGQLVHSPRALSSASRASA